MLLPSALKPSSELMPIPRVRGIMPTGKIASTASRKLWRERGERVLKESRGGSSREMKIVDDATAVRAVEEKEKVETEMNETNEEV
eukprot:Trichotokara_eunicae@DN6774_c0_g1_i1.p1